MQRIKWLASNLCYLKTFQNSVRNKCHLPVFKYQITNDKELTVGKLGMYKYY